MSATIPIGLYESLEVTKELASKADIARLEGKIENEILRLDRKFTIMFVILFFTILFLNQNALEFMAKVLGLIKYYAA